MKIDVLLGLQWGDEGKGKIVDVLTPDYDIIARFQGGPNAGHTLVFNNTKYVLHLIPSGIFRNDVINVIGSGVVLDPAIFKEETDGLNIAGIDLHKNLYISEKAFLITPSHRLSDAAYEHAKGKKKIGSTLKGIGPTYTDKIGRNGLRVGDIFQPDFIEKYNKLKEIHKKRLSVYNLNFDVDEYEKKWFEGIENLKRYKIINSEKFFNDALNSSKKILAEGAQGTLLDINFGTYPYVTSSTTTSAGVCTGLGVAPNKIGEVYGIFKAYITRVGSGPFPTELFDDDGKKLRDKGHEYGATTGRERRCGWMDMVALKYSIQVNGVTQLIMTKADVMSGFENFYVAEKYNTGSEIIDFMPYSINKYIEPIYNQFRGWKEKLDNAKTFTDFPTELQDYIKYIENETNVPVTIISTGADRKAIVYK